MAKSFTLDDLIALNEEISSLVRAGVPLELGLAAWGRDVRGDLGRFASQLSAEGRQGEDLGQVLAHHADRVPPVYVALVKAGQKSGRLGDALESLARTARHLGDVRGAVGMAILYPLLVILLAYGLGVIVLSQFLPSIVNFYEGNSPRWMSLAAQLTKTADSPWVWLPPVLLVLAVLVWWSRTRRAILVNPVAAARWLGWIPCAGRVVRNARRAALAEIMSLLVEHGVPLHESIVLAAECTGDRRIVGGAREFATAIEMGSPIDERARQLEGFPSLVTWAVATRGMQGSLAALARHTADADRRQVARDGQWLKDFLPMWLTVVAGGFVAAMYALVVFGPYSEMLRLLGGNLSQSMRITP